MFIRIKVIVVIAAIVAAITFSSVAVGFRFSRQNLINTMENDMSLVGKIAGRQLTTEIIRLKEEINSAAARLSEEEVLPSSLRKQGEKYNYLFLAILDHDSTVSWVSGVDADSSTANSASIPNASFLESPEGKRVLEGETLLVSSTVPGMGGAVFHLYTPLDGRVLVAAIQGLYFSGKIADYQIWKTGYVFVINREGDFIAHPDVKMVVNRVNYIKAAETSLLYRPVADFFRKMLQGGSGVSIYSLFNIQRVSAYTEIEGSDGWALGAVSPISESPVALEQRILLISGAVFLLLGLIAAVAAANFIASPFEQIREQNKTLEELRLSAESASEAKSSFLANMSHEMRTPLNAIIGFAELEIGIDGRNDGEKENIEKIYTSGITLLGLINDILDISKIESGKFTLVPVVYSTPSLINDTVTLNAVRIGSRPITFTLDISADIPNQLYGDELRIKQILNNLLSNAFKYTREGNVTLKVRCEEDSESGDPKKQVYLVCSVIDTGIGIHKEDIEKIFGEYNQVDTKSNRSIEGTGLGLAITQRMAAMMEGSISVESEYGKGSTFTVRLKQDCADRTPIGEDVAENLKNYRYTLSRGDFNRNIVRVRIPYAKVLVVDDMQVNLDVARGMLRPYGMTIDCALSGEEAVRIIREAKVKYNAVFMDHMMPGMDGLEAVRIIRNEIDSEYAKNIPIIALTANAITGTEEVFLKNGFQAFLTKPIDIIRLNEAIKRWVRDKDLEKELRTKGELTEQAPVETNKLYDDPRISAFEENPPQGFDYKKALERFGDIDAYADSLKSYMIHTPPLLEELKASAQAEMADQYRITVHGLKSSSYAIGAEHTGKLAEELEKKAASKDLDFMVNHTAALTGSASELIAWLSKILERIQSGEEKPLKHEPDSAVLMRIMEAAEAYDQEGLDNALADLEKFNYENGAQLGGWIKEQADSSGFEAIAEKLLQEGFVKEK